MKVNEHRNRAKRIFFLLQMALLLICLSSLFLVTEGKAGSGNSQADRASNRKRGTCENTECEHLHFLENTNCVNKCVSRKCYDDVYKGKELEDGEINTGLERLFKNCVRSESIRNRRTTK